MKIDLQIRHNNIFVEQYDWLEGFPLPNIGDKFMRRHAIFHVSEKIFDPGNSLIIINDTTTADEE